MSTSGKTDRKLIRLLVLPAALLVAAGFASVALAQGSGVEPGPPHSSFLGTPVPLTEKFRFDVQGDYVAAGVGLRNTGAGSITITLPGGSTVVKALLYWAVMDNEFSATLASGTFNGQPITGTLVGSDAHPCWSGTIFNFRADVTSFAVSGVNTVSLSSGTADGVPRLEGASLVVVYSQPGALARTVIIRDGAVSFSQPPEVSTTFTGFAAFGSPPQAKTTWIVADGQQNVAGLDNRLFVDGIQIANHALNGAGPGTQFWDTRTDDISGFVLSGDTSVTVAIESNKDVTGSSFDCLTWVAQVFSVTKQNQAPTANAQSVTTAEDTAVAITLTGSDPEGTALAFTVTGGPSNGTLSGTAPDITYTPNGNFNGTDSFTFTVSDGLLTSEPATVSITVTEVNDPPVANPDSKTTAEDIALSFPASGLTANDSAGPANESGQTLTVTAVSSPSSAGGAVSLSGVLVTYTPAQDYNGPDSFTYTVCDNGTTNGVADPKCVTGTVNVTVTPVNDPPRFDAANQTVLEDAGPKSVAITGVAPGPPTATDEASQTVTLTATSSNTAIVPHPTIAGTGATRTLSYQSAPDANGDVAIRVTAQDNGGTLNGGVDTFHRTFTITVTPVNDPPRFDAITNQTVLEDAGLKSVPITGVAPGPPTATDEAGQTVTLTASSSNPAIVPHPTIDGAGATRTLSYQSAPDANGTVTITVTAQDNGGILNGGVDTFPRTFTITVTPVNDPPRFDAIANQTVLEDQEPAPQTVTITGITAGPAALTDDEDFSQTVTLVATSSNPDIVPSPTIEPSPIIGTGTHGFKTRTLRYQPAPDANGTVTITVTATDNGGTANGGVDTFTRTFTITVTPVNDPPFFGLIRGQLLDKAIEFPNSQAMVITVAPGPVTARDEAGQTLTLTPSVVNPASVPNLISNLQVTPTSDPTIWTLTYNQAANAFGEATITLTAQDNGPAGTSNGDLNTATTTFKVRVLDTVTEKRNTVAALAPPASASGFRSGDKLKATATFTAPALGQTEQCVFVLRPDPHLNVIPRVNGKDATHLPEGRPVVIDQASLLKVCPASTAEQRTVSIEITLNDWYPELLGRADGTQFYTLNYVNLVQDPDTSCTEADCVTLLTGSADTTGVVATGSHCPELGAFGTGAGGTGCPFADKNTVTLHTVNLGGGTSTTEFLVGVQVKVFDRNDESFQKFVADLTGATLPCPSCKNPDGSLYGLIFEGTADKTQIDLNTTHALVGSCATSDGTDNPADKGICFAGETFKGDFLAIVKFVDRNNGATVYVGRPKSPSDFDASGVASKDFQVIKVLKNGVLQGYRGGSKTVMKGSVLEMITPDSAVWEGTTSIYPFIFTSDSGWTVDVCAYVPAGYQIVGVYDENGTLIATTACAQIFVANQTKVVAFEVVDVGSPEPALDATLTITDPHGKRHVKKLTVSDIRRTSFDSQVRALKRAAHGKTPGGVPHGHSH